MNACGHFLPQHAKTTNMFGVSGMELVVIGVVALLLFGPDKLPEIAKTMGKLLGEFRKHSDSVRREVYNAMYPPAQELKNEFEQERRKLRALRDELDNEVRSITADINKPELQTPGVSPPTETKKEES